MPDRRGNNRIDTLKNLIRDDRIALCFLVPGSTTILRINGRAKISIEPELLASFAVDDKPPRSVIIIKAEAVYFQCGRAVLRSRLWEKDAQIDPETLPSPGEVLAAISAGEFDGKTYDDEWPGRAQKSLW